MARDRRGLRAVRQERRQERRDERRADREQKRDDREQKRDDREQKRDDQGGDRGDQRRRRRSPEVARQELLDAAERLFTRERPDDVGLKDVAREAGTSHALITHYFGTYAGLVESVLHRRLLRLRDSTTDQLLRDSSVLARPDELIAALFRTLGDPVHVRLMKWVLASGQQESLQVYALQQQGVQLVARQVAKALMADPAHQSVLLAYEPSAQKLEAELVAEIELSLVTAVAAALGFALTKPALAASIGKQPTPELDEAMQKTLSAMLQAYMREAIARRALGPIASSRTR